ncbi:MAG TPA: putative toxin-antitoxin system toxin component, PIN family [Candidatus Cloacimonetes bacterium]|nr:putative toxin-antitoxin system toxin component, PIN family [Candidatus Cloacimonadota bacterium]
MIRVVIDTNIFVSSFFGGYPRKIISYWKNRKLLLCLSRPIVDEYFKVFQRLGLGTKEQFKELVSLFANGYNIVFTSKTPELKIVENDPDDDKFIECAVALNGDYIISGDKHLLDIQKYINIKIVTPKQFMDIFTVKSR